MLGSVGSKLCTCLIAKAIRISRAKFHCSRLTTVQDIQDYASLIFGGTVCVCVCDVSCISLSRCLQHGQPALRRDVSFLQTIVCWRRRRWLGSATLSRSRPAWHQRHRQSCWHYVYRFRSGKSSSFCDRLQLKYSNAISQKYCHVACSRIACWYSSPIMIIII